MRQPSLSRRSDVDSGRPHWRIALRGTAIVILTILAVLGAVALGADSTATPPDRSGALQAIPGFAAAVLNPGLTSLVFIVTVTGLAGLISRLRQVPGRGALPATFAVVLVVATIAAAFPAFHYCRSPASPALAPVTDTLVLFGLSFERDSLELALDQARCSPPPVGLETARVLAVVAAFAAAITLLLRISQNLRNRLELARRPGRAIIVIGLDDDGVQFVKNVVDGSRDRTVFLLTVAPSRPCVEAAREYGVRVIVIDIDSRSDFRSLFPAPLRMWRSASPERLYLLSSDPALNEKRLGHAIEAGMLPSNPLHTAEIETIPRVILRFDDVWMAEDWQAQRMKVEGYVVDVVGVYTATAEMLLRPYLTPVDDQISTLDVLAPDTSESTRDTSTGTSTNRWPRPLIIVGSGPLTTALLGWMADRARELRVLDPEQKRIGVGANDLEVLVVCEDADELCHDHVTRQRRHGGHHMTLEALPCAPGEVGRMLGTILTDRPAGEESLPVVVFTDDPTVPSSTLAPRIAYRNSHVAVLQYRAEIATPTDGAVAPGRVTGFGITLAQRHAVTMLERWNRLGELLHARFIIGQSRKYVDHSALTPELAGIQTDWLDYLAVPDAERRRGRPRTMPVTGRDRSNPRIPRRISWQPSRWSANSSDQFHAFLVADNSRAVVTTLATLNALGHQGSALGVDAPVSAPWGYPLPVDRPDECSGETSHFYDLYDGSATLDREQRAERGRIEALRTEIGPPDCPALDPSQVYALTVFEKMIGLSPVEITRLAARESASWVDFRRRQKPPWRPLSDHQRRARSELAREQQEIRRAERAGHLDTAAVAEANARLGLIEHLLTCAEERNRCHAAVTDWDSLDPGNRWKTYCTVMEMVSFLQHLGYLPSTGTDPSDADPHPLPSPPPPARLRWGSGSTEPVVIGDYHPATPPAGSSIRMSVVEREADT